jgi:hypothetical protein
MRHFKQNPREREEQVVGGAVIEGYYLDTNLRAVLSCPVRFVN